MPGTRESSDFFKVPGTFFKRLFPECYVIKRGEGGEKKDMKQIKIFKSLAHIKNRAGNFLKVPRSIYEGVRNCFRVPQPYRLVYTAKKVIGKL